MKLLPPREESTIPGHDRALDPDVLATMLVSMSGTAVPHWLETALASGLGGVVLFGHNVPDLGSARRLSADLHAAAGGRALIAIDEEGGDVTRLEAATGSSLPTAAAFGAVDDPELTRRAGRALGDLLQAVGIDLDLAPVADVATRAENPVIGTRSVGASPALVTRHAAAFARGLRDAGVLACAKHFPGHGDTAQDSHTSLPRIDLDTAVLHRDHLAPFAQLARSGAIDALMTAHVLVPALGEGPASLAPWSTALAHELGAESVIITDALDMAGASGEIGFAEACVRALEAGADLLCLGTAIRRDDQQMVLEAHDAILGALRTGRLEREQLRRRAGRVATMRERRRGGRSVAQANAAGDPPPSFPTLLAALQEIGEEVSQRALSVEGDLPVCPEVSVVDARRRRAHVSGSGDSHLSRVLAGRGMLVEGPAPYTVVITRRGTASAEEMAALEEHPGAIVVHTGVSALAPWPGGQGPRAVLPALGASRVMMEAVASRLATGAR